MSDAPQSVDALGSEARPFCCNQTQYWKGLEMTDSLGKLTKPAMELDRIDARLLDLLQHNNRLTSEAFGAKVGLSGSAVQRRLKRLRSEGVIEADVSIISPKAIGRTVTMLVLVSFESNRTNIVDRFKRACRRMPEVMNGFYVGGQVDFVLLVTAKSVEEYECFSRRLVHETPDIKRFESMVILDRVKAGFTVPMAS